MKKKINTIIYNIFCGASAGMLIYIIISFIDVNLCNLLEKQEAAWNISSLLF